MDKSQRKIDLLAGAGNHDKLSLDAGDRILVFDSGLGGLTVLSELQKLPLDVQYIYAADSAAFPYGGMPAEDLQKRVCRVMEHLLETFRPKLAVVACNTVSTLTMPQLRQIFSIPFIATVPAVKPAALLSQTGYFTVLATPGTISRQYTKELISAYAGRCQVNLVGSPNLAVLAEKKMQGEKVSDDEILAEILPCFIEVGALRTDVIAMACTHYPLLLEEFKRLAPWPVKWIDPAPAIANHLFDIVEQKDNTRNVADKHFAVFTSADGPAQYMKNALPQWLLDDVLIEQVSS